MIHEKQAKKYCREDISLIKNYSEAVADTKHYWLCHHVNGEPFTGFNKEQLKKMNMYYKRPASELKFVTRHMHSVIHGDTQPKSEQTKQKISNSCKQYYSAEKRTHASVPLSEEHKEKIRKAAYGNKRGLGNKSMKGKHWYNNGKINVHAETCPAGFISGMLKRKK